MGLRVGEKSFPKKKEKKIYFFWRLFYIWSIFEKTFAGLIERKFSNYNVYNFGVGSYSPSVHLYKLKKTLNENIIPEKILLFLDLTDLIDEASRWEYIDSMDKVKLTNDHLFQTQKKKKCLRKEILN